MHFCFQTCCQDCDLSTMVHPFISWLGVHLRDSSGAKLLLLLQLGAAAAAAHLPLHPMVLCRLRYPACGLALSLGRTRTLFFPEKWFQTYFFKKGTVSPIKFRKIRLEISAFLLQR